MSYLYTLVSRLFTTEQPTEEVAVNSESDQTSLLTQMVDDTQSRVHNMDDSNKVAELQRLVDRLDVRLKEAHSENEKIYDIIDCLTKEKNELEVKYTKVCESNRILRERFLKEPEVTTLFAGLDLMTINQFKNIIPKMDLNEFSDLTNKDKYFNACMFMFVRKFNHNNKDYNVNDFIEYVLTNDSLTVGVREYFNNNEHNAQVRRELGNFYEFSKLIAE
jgi:hypothetical protein